MPFPTYTHTTLDDFNRTDEHPVLGGGAWTTYSGWPESGAVVSNQLTGGSSDFWASLRTDSYSDFEIAFDMPTAEPTIGERFFVIQARMGTSPVVDNWDGYDIQFDNLGEGITLNVVTDGVGSTLDSAASPSWLSGDKFGVQCIGNAISAWRYTSGAWSELLSATDGTYTAGHFAIAAYGTLVRFDNLTLGVAAAAAPASKRGQLLGIG